MDLSFKPIKRWEVGGWHSPIPCGDIIVSVGFGSAVLVQCFLDLLTQVKRIKLLLCPEISRNEEIASTADSELRSGGREPFAMPHLQQLSRHREIASP